MSNYSAIHGPDFSTLTAINCVRIDSKNARADAIKEHEVKIATLNTVLAECDKREAILLADLNLDQIDRARKVVFVYSLWTESWDSYSNKRKPTDFTQPPHPCRVALLKDAIEDIATATDKMKREYFGLKNYDRWSHQREDHSYGMGPRHGSIVFEIGLTDEARKEPGLTIQQRDDAIYYLRNLERIQRAEGTAQKDIAA